MSLVIRGSVARARRFDIDTTGLRIDRRPECPFPTNYVRLRNAGTEGVRMVFEASQFALAPAEVDYAVLAPGEIAEFPLEIVAHTGPTAPDDGLWLRAEIGSQTVEVIYFQKR